MKFLTFLALGFASASSIYAGGMGGPFTSYSPLQSGIDGVYQATARGTNLTGIISFAYNNGVPVTGGGNNRWVFFINGQIVRGQTSAAIDDDKIAGILDTGAIDSQTDESGNPTLPMIIMNAGSSSSGYFDGKIDLKSVNARFSGKGLITPSPGMTNQITIISENTITEGSGASRITTTGIGVTNATYTNLPGTTPETEFKFSGYRLTTLGSATGASTNSGSDSSMDIGSLSGF